MPPGQRLVEIETVVGIEDVATREVTRRLGRTGAVVLRDEGPGRFLIRLPLDLALAELDRLGTVVAAHRVEEFAVARPRALLGHEHLARIVRLVGDVIDSRPPDSFKSLRISAAGSGSPVMRRIADEIGRSFGLSVTTDQADLLVAIRPGPGAGQGWSVLVRTTPRPLSSRPWRICDMPGALNGSVARAMVELTDPIARDAVLNVGCGSGTLLIERLLHAPARLAVGVDHDATTLDCAVTNVTSAKLWGRAVLVRADATVLPFPDQTFDVVMADLPFGMLVSPEPGGNQLYRGIFVDAARVARPGARFIAITTRRRAVEAILARRSGWGLDRAVTVRLPYQRGYITPTIFVLQRT